MKRLSIYITFLLLLIFSGCAYMPFAKYYLAGNKLPKFSKKNHERGSKTPERLAYDITCYDWTIRPDYNKKSVEGNMKIYFKGGLEHNIILIDLQRRLKIDSILSTQTISKYKRKGDALFVYFEENLALREDYVLDIHYHGKPANIADQGPVVWTEDRSGNPFYSTLTQGIGPYYLFPCKDMLYDEPDSCIIRVGIPGDLQVVANGKLVNKELKNGLNYFTWKVKNPINVYNISFNVGKYRKIELSNASASTETQSIAAWVLEEDLEKGSEFYSQSIIVMQEYEDLFGPFPWKNDGCAFVETAINGGAMEHQSAISMGRILRNDWRPDSTEIHLNSTLIHELSHEWWGNSVTADDYCDAWLHEGLATYCEALIPERIYGRKAYSIAISQTMAGIENERPVHKTCGVRYNSWVNRKDFDIYNKGAALLHTIRKQLNNDELFFKALRQIYTTHQKENLDTETFRAQFEEVTGKDLKPYFEVYLERKTPPIMQYHFNPETQELFYRWKEQLPEGFDMEVLLGEVDFLRIHPTYEYQKVKLRSTADQNIAMPQFGYIRIEKDKKFKG